MQNIGNKVSDYNSVPSSSNCLNSPTWWNSNGSYVPESSSAKNQSMNLRSLMQQGNQTKDVNPRLQDKDSPSTQSSDQSQDGSSSRGDDIQEQSNPGQTGNGSSYEQGEAPKKSLPSMGTTEVFQPRKFDYSQSILACGPYNYVDPYGTFLPGYGSNALIHSQMVGMMSATRVPLPLEPTTDEPIYVNAKQYHGILRRRQLRAKQEAENKLIKARKPYLHESRHRHAMNRVRGAGGRFLNTKKNEQQNGTGSASDKPNFSGSILQLGGGAALSAANSRGTFQNQDHLGFSDFHLHVGNGSQRIMMR